MTVGAPDMLGPLASRAVRVYCAAGPPAAAVPAHEDHLWSAAGTSRWMQEPVDAGVHGCAKAAISMWNFRVGAEFPAAT